MQQMQSWDYGKEFHSKLGSTWAPTFDFSLVHTAKQAALSGGALSALVVLLDDRKSEVRAAAAGALMR